MRRALVLTVVLLAGCGSGGGASPEVNEPESLTLGEALCNDLASGMTPIQIYGGVSDEYDPERFAEVVAGAVANDCPEQFGNDLVAVYLEQWGYSAP